MIEVMKGNSWLAGEIYQRQNEKYQRTINRIATPYSCAIRSMALVNVTMIGKAVMMTLTVE